MPSRSSPLKTLSKSSPITCTNPWADAFVDPQMGKLGRRILRDSARPEALRDEAFRRVILAIPAGRVSTYGKVAAAAGYPLYHRAVARLLRTETPDRLPWHRVVGAGGQLKLRQDAQEEQRQRLIMEGVVFCGLHVDMAHYEHHFRPWEH